MERKKILPGRYSIEEFVEFIAMPAKEAGLSDADYVRQSLGMPPKTVKRGAPQVHGRYADWREKHPKHEKPEEPEVEHACFDGEKCG